MKKILALLSLLLFGILLHAQDNPPGFKSLADAFSKRYYSETNSEENFFARMSTVGDPFFSIDNADFVNQVLHVSKDKKISFNAAARSTIDSVLYIFSYTDLTNEYAAPFTKMKDLLVLYNTAICNCVTPKLKAAGDRGAASAQFMYKCMEELARDTAYVSYMRNKGSQYSRQELQAMQNPATAYLYLQCPSMYQWYTGNIGSNAYSIIQLSHARMFDADQQAASFYSQNNIAQLKLLFPSYQEYQQPINALLPVTKIKDIAFLPERKFQSASVLMTKTYYTPTATGDPVIHGQAVYVFSNGSDYAHLQSLSFTPAAQLKNKAALVKKIKDDRSSAPVRVEVLQEAVIDTVPKPKKN